MLSLIASTNADGPGELGMANGRKKGPGKPGRGHTGNTKAAKLVSAGTPVGARSESARSPENVQTKSALRRRTNQERIDAAGKLRRKGISFDEIGIRLGCSEKTIRRIAGHIQPELRLPDAESGLDTDPRELRDALLGRFFTRLYLNQQLRNVTIIWRMDGEDEKCGPPTSRFLSIAEKQLRNLCIS